MSTDRIVRNKRRSLLLRIHFWAALIASPFALVAALTGLLYVFTPQIEQSLYGRLDHVTPARKQRPLDDIVQAASCAAPQGFGLRSVAVPVDADRSVQVMFSPQASAPSADPRAVHSHAAQASQALPSVWGDRLPRGVLVYVNPYSGAVLGSHPEMGRFNLWARRLHSSLLQGDRLRWPIELAASWLMVMLATGTVLWWPRGGGRILPRADARGRAAWTQWHAFAGIALSLLSLAMLTTGLTWSRYAGGQIRMLRDAVGQASPNPPRGLASLATTGAQRLGWESVLRAAREQAPGVPLVLMPPSGEQGVWRITAVDRGEPLGRFTLVLDAYSGQKLFYAGWDRQTAFGKATAVGIPFHRGELGWWNQILLFLFGSGVVFSLVSGWVMAFKRWRHGAPVPPPLLPGAWKSLPAGAWIATALLLALMPLLAACAPVIVLAEAIIAWRRRPRHGFDA
jgi:uncharacterized iron-regulated membrane protein